jgi:hypothetical protein
VIKLDGKAGDKPLHHSVDLSYPEIYQDEKTTIEISMCHVRAADSIRISYDADRDGWVIEQAAVFEWPVDDPVCDPGWAEVAFVEAWGREKKEG